MASTKNKKRTYGRYRELSRRGNEKRFETDGTYLLKLVSVFLLGTLWLKFQAPIVWTGWTLTGIPVGFIVGLFLIKKFEKHQSNRKILYAVLLTITILSYFLPAGVMI